MKNEKWKVKIDDIKNEGVLEFDFDDYIKELDACNVSAKIELKDLGDFIEAKGHAKGKITLECDRCLNKYEHVCCTPCGHLFCWSCIHLFLNEKNFCPKCKLVCKPQEILFLQNYLS